MFLADISCELSRHATQVYLSLRNGAWIAPRLRKGGIPSDIVFLKRANQLIPQCLLGHIIKHSLEQKYNHTNLGLESDKSPDRLGLVINDELPHRIVTGSVLIKSEISQLEKKAIIFKDGSRVEDIDFIILATGFEVKLPALPEFLQPSQKVIPFYKYVFPPSLKFPTLAVIGAIRVSGPIPPIAELQARWATRVFLRKCSLPTKEVMLKDVEKTAAAKLKKFGNNKRVNNVSIATQLKIKF